MADTSYAIAHSYFGSPGNNTFEALQTLVITMKSAGWFTRGSSRNGSAGTAFSATPDGVDHWAGLTTKEEVSSGAAPVWHVLQHNVSGIQVCIEYHWGGTLVRPIVAKNKFETGGAWRNAGSVSSSVRPADTTSSPAQDNEVWYNMGAANWFSSTVVGMEIHFMVRRDGEAVWVIERSNSNTNEQVWGFFKLFKPLVGETNPWIVITQRALSYSSLCSTNTVNVIGRHPSGIARYGMYRYASSPTTFFQEGTLGPDLFNGGKYRLAPIAIWTISVSPTPDHIRVTIPDVLMAPSSWVTGDTVNDKQYVVWGDLAFPWDGVTSLGGTEREAEYLALSIEDFSRDSMGALQGLNIGVEVL